MSRITLGGYDDPEVDILGELYTVRPVTKPIQAAMDAADKLIIAAPDAETLIKAYGAALDVRLQQTKDKQPKASAVIKKGWADGTVAMNHVAQLVTDIADTDRPT